MKGQIKVGSYTGTGAAINVSIGFVPDFVLLTNATDGDIAAMWFNGMSAGTAIDIATAAQTTGTITNAADGITAYAGTRAGVGAGFTVGTDYSENAKVMRYIAIANQ
jgi:hypothetical protein